VDFLNSVCYKTPKNKLRIYESGIGLKMSSLVWQKSRGAGRRFFKCVKWLDARTFLEIIVISVMMNLFLESMGVRSFTESLYHLVTDPLIFGAVRPHSTRDLSGRAFRSPQSFVLTLISMLWIGMGIANCVLLIFGHYAASPPAR
jgi:hypothetical protein